jgi:hypothetical protein
VLERQPYDIDAPREATTSAAWHAPLLAEANGEAAKAGRLAAFGRRALVLADPADDDLRAVAQDYAQRTRGRGLGEGEAQAVETFLGLGEAARAEERASAYLACFDELVTADEGRFLVCASVDDLEWRSPPDAETRAALAGLHPPRVIARGADDGWRIEAFVQFGDAGFRVVQRVAPQGLVVMEEDEPILQTDALVIDAERLPRLLDLRTPPT